MALEAIWEGLGCLGSCFECPEARWEVVSGIKSVRDVLICCRWGWWGVSGSVLGVGLVGWCVCV